MGDRRGLGEAVALHQLTPGELLEPPLDLHGQRGGAADAGLDRGEVVVPRLGVIDDPHVHGRRAREQGGLVPLDGGDHLLDLEPGQEYDGRGDVEAQVQDHRHAVDVEEGQDGQHPLVAVGLVGDHPQGRLDGVHRQVPVGQHGPLGRPRGAPRVLEEGQVLEGVDFHLGRAGVYPLEHLRGEVDALLTGHLHGVALEPHPEREEQLEHPRELLRDGGDDDMLKPRLLPDGPHRRVEHVEGHYRARTGVLELEGQLPLHVHRVAGDHDRPELQGAVIGVDELGHVGQQERHPVPLAHTEALQKGRELIGQAVDLAVGPLPVEEHGADPIRVLGRGVL